LLKPKGSIDARQYAAAFVTQCTLSLNDWEGSLAGLCQCGYFVMFCAPNAKILTEVSEKSYTPKNLVRIKLPSPIFDAAGSQRLLRRGGQQRARFHSCNAVLADRHRTNKYQLAPPSARLQEQGMTPLLPPRG